MPASKMNPFDFSDTSDLPENIAKQLTPSSDKGVAAREWGAVVVAGKAAGLNELNINQIMAAAIRLGMEVPTSQTVRGYLNKAVDLGIIVKATRQSYAAAPAKGRTKAEEAGLADTAEVITGDVPEAIEVDPLAGL